MAYSLREYADSSVDPVPEHDRHLIYGDFIGRIDFDSKDKVSGRKCFLSSRSILFLSRHNVPLLHELHA